MTPDAAPRRRKVQSAEFGLAVLKGLADMGGAASLTALAEALGENPAKIHRYLASLKQADFVVQGASGQRYSLGPAALAIGLAAMRRIDVLDSAAPEIAALAETRNAVAFVAVFGNRGPAIMRWEEPMQPVTVNVRVGSVLPILWSATGRAFAAFMRSSVIDALIDAELAAATPDQRRIAPDRAAAEAIFEATRRAGCTAICDTLLRDVSAVAVPVFDFSGRVAAVITALGTSGEIDPDPDAPLAQDMKSRAAALSRALGHAPA